MTRDIETVAEDLVAWLRGRGYVMREEKVGGLGSWRVLGDGRFVVTVNNDRGALSILIGFHPAAREEDTHPLAYWALCLGLRAVHAEDPLDWTPSHEEMLERARGDAQTTRNMLEMLPSLPAEELAAAESCARRRQVAYWREMGLWPLPGPDAVLRRKEPDERRR